MSAFPIKGTWISANHTNLVKCECNIARAYAKNLKENETRIKPDILAGKPLKLALRVIKMVWKTNDLITMKKQSSS